MGCPLIFLCALQRALLVGEVAGAPSYQPVLSVGLSNPQLFKGVEGEVLESAVTANIYSIPAPSSPVAPLTPENIACTDSVSV